MLVGFGLGFTSINPIKALFYSAVINGLVAVPLIVLILILAARNAVMGPYRAKGPIRPRRDHGCGHGACPAGMLIPAP